MEYKRGECFWVAHNNYAEGSEQMYRRPAVIVSNNKGNANAPILEVVYMTDSKDPCLPTHVGLKKTSTGELEGSTILCEQIHTISKKRVPDATDYICRLSDEDMDAVDDALIVSLGLDYMVVEKESTEEIPQNGGVETEKIIGFIDDKFAEVLEHMDNAGSAAECPAEDELSMVKMEAEFYKRKYDELMERIMVKAKI